MIPFAGFGACQEILSLDTVLLAVVVARTALGCVGAGERENIVVYSLSR